MTKKGDLVVFKKDLYKDEEGAIYRVLEVNGDRVVIELMNTNMAIRPQSVALVADIECIEKDTNNKLVAQW